MKTDKLLWMKAAGIRAVKTVAQTAVATIGTATVIGSVDWKMVLPHLYFLVFYLCLLL